MKGMVRILLRGVALGLGAVWWWAALRLAAGQGAGVLEGAVVAGGWGISLLPVHCVPKTRATGAVAAGRREGAWQAGTGTGPARSGEASGPR